MNERLAREYHQEKGAGRRRSLHARMAMDEHRMFCAIFAEHFVGDFRCPCLHIIDLRRLEIVVHRNTILIRHRWMKSHLFCTIEHRLDSVLVEPLFIQSRLPSPNPDTGYNLICIFCRIHVTYSLVSKISIGTMRSG